MKMLEPKPMSSSDEQLEYKRNLNANFRNIKRLPHVHAFQAEMNGMHRRAYDVAVRHYGEAMDATLSPKQKEAVLERVKTIRELWDSMDDIVLQATHAKMLPDKVPSTPEERKKALSKLYRYVKRLPNAQAFQDVMNVLHSRAYYTAENHYGDALYIELPPRKKKAVLAKVEEIRERDGIKEAQTSETLANRTSEV
jgi:hypothetical protein